MSDTERRAARKPAVRQRPDAAEKPRPVLSFRVHADLHARLKASTEANGYAMTEEVERRLLKSFDLEEKVATLTEFRDLVNERDARLWPDEAARLLGTAFAMTLSQAQQRANKSWCESQIVATVVSETIRALMLQHSRKSLFEELGSEETVRASIEAVSASVGAFLDETMPPLAAPSFGGPRWTNRARLVTIFRDKKSGDVLQTVVGSEFDVSNLDERRHDPELTAALERFRPRQDDVEVQVSLSYAMEDGGSVWESLSDPEVAEAAFRVSAPRVKASVATAAEQRRPLDPSNDTPGDDRGELGGDPHVQNDVKGSHKRDRA